MKTIDLHHPSNIVIETTALCILNCAMCARQSAGRPLGNMKPDRVHEILRQIAELEPETIRVWFCFLGEPLMLKNRLPGYIAYGKSLGIRHHIINTNGILLTRSMSERLIEAGLTEIYIGIDAVTAETYEAIRVGGNFDVLMKNMDDLLALKPADLQVTVQLIEMERNRHERPQFEAYWQERGVRTFIKKELGWIDRMTQSPDQNQRAKRYPCPWVLDTFGIYWNGSIPFCVNDWEGQTVFSHMDKAPLREVWEEMMCRFGRPHVQEKWDVIPAICQSCLDWRGKEKRSIVGTEIFEESA